MRRILLFLSGMIAGGGTGAAISYLFAPKASQELRKNVTTHFKQSKMRSKLAAETYESELRHELAELTGQNLPRENS